MSITANSRQEESLPLNLQQQTRLLDALGELSDDAQSALLLRETRGLSYAEIANILECPCESVREYIYRARRHLLMNIRDGFEKPPLS